MTDTGQCSHYQIKLSGNGTVRAHITVLMNSMQAQLKNVSSATINPTRTKRKYYCWSYWSNFTQGSKSRPSKKSRHKEEAYYNKILGGSEKGRELRLGAIINKIEISNPIIS